MRAKNGMIYQNNYARTAAFYEATCAPAVENDLTKKAANEFLISIYRTIGEQCDDIGLKAVSDVFFQPWEQQKGREADVKVIRTPFIKIEELMEQLFFYCRNAVITEKGLSVSTEIFSPKKIFISVLSAAGAPVTKKGKIEINCGKDCAEGLKKLSELAVTTRTDGTEDLIKSVFYFSRCVFDHDVDWLSQCFDDMMDADGRIVFLCAKLNELGYHREVMIDGRYISLNYVKEYGKKAEPIKRAWADKSHLGIEISYEDLCIVPATLHIRLPRFAELLSRFDEIPDDAKKLIFEKVKNCDGCRYCVRTDKSGMRPLAAIAVEGVRKCPYFPSFSLRWNEVSEELPKQIMSLLEAYTIFGDKQLPRSVIKARL